MKSRGKDFASQTQFLPKFPLGPDSSAPPPTWAILLSTESGPQIERIYLYYYGRSHQVVLLHSLTSSFFLSMQVCTVWINVSLFCDAISFGWSCGKQHRSLLSALILLTRVKFEAALLPVVQALVLDSEFGKSRLSECHLWPPLFQVWCKQCKMNMLH